MGRSGKQTARGGQGIVFRQAERGCHVVCRAHGKVAHRRGIIQLHEPRQHFTESPVAADTGNCVKICTVAGGKAGGIALGAGKEKSGAVAALIKQRHGLPKIELECTAPSHGVDDQHEGIGHKITSLYEA